MRTWIRPKIIEECFVSNENIANSVMACYKIACEVGRPNGNNSYDYSNGPQWSGKEFGRVWHESSGTGNCSDANSNRVLTDGMVQGSSIQEHSSDLGWINGKIDTIELGTDNKVSPGDVVYWYTKTTDGKRRWNHKGVIQVLDASHPNHS